MNPTDSAGRARISVMLACLDHRFSRSLAMTRPTQKRSERFFVEQAAKLLGKTWSLQEDREHPDFIITEGEQRFGLEVCEIFTGQQDRAGSAMKRTESGVHRQLEALRREYESVAQTTLRVQIVGRLSPESMAAIVPAIVAEDLASKPVGHHLVIDQGNGLRLHVTKAFRPEWFSINQRVGWVDRNPLPIIADAIKKKSSELERYRAAAGPDIRLLLVADRILNSGKLMLDDTAALDTEGFQVVYLFPYPEAVIIFSAQCDAA
jgi:hypothetical protein